MPDVGRFEREEVRGVNVEDACDWRRFEGLQPLPVPAPQSVP